MVPSSSARSVRTVQDRRMESQRHPEIQSRQSSSTRSAGNMQSRRMGSQPHSYVQTGRSRTMPQGLTDDRTDSSAQTITFSPNNLRPRFCTWLRHELTRLEDYLKAITLSNITNWEEGKNLFGSAHHTLKKILNRTYNELERNINSDRFEKYHAAHRFKVKLDISPALNSAKNAQINMAQRISTESPFDFHVVWTLKDTILRAIYKAYNIPYVTNNSLR